MEHIELEEYPKHAAEQVREIPEVDDGFQDQPDLGSRYDPGEDKRDMYRLGKRQELKRRFRYCKCHTHPAPGSAESVVAGLQHLRVMESHHLYGRPGAMPQTSKKSVVIFARLPPLIEGRALQKYAATVGSLKNRRPAATGSPGLASPRRACVFRLTKCSFHCWLYRRPWQLLGILYSDKRVLAREWRHCWGNLDDNTRLRGSIPDGPQSGRSGVNGC